MNSTAERVGSSAALGLSVAYLAVATQLPNQSPNISDAGPRIYPLALAIVGSIVSAIWVLTAFRGKGKKTANSQPDTGQYRPTPNWGRVGALVATIFIFPISVEYITFIPASAIVLFVLTFIIPWRVPKVRYTIIPGIFAITAAVALQYLFTDIVSINLP